MAELGEGLKKNGAIGRDFVRFGEVAEWLTRDLSEVGVGGGSGAKQRVEGRPRVRAFGRRREPRLGVVASGSRPRVATVFVTADEGEEKHMDRWEFSREQCLAPQYSDSVYR
jgi:hypothetical protein